MVDVTQKFALLFILGLVVVGAGLVQACSSGGPEAGLCQTEGCDDGDECTTDECRADGTCSHAAVDCSDLNGECLVGVCDPADGACAAAAAHEGELCSDDGNACNGISHCGAGECLEDVAAVDCSELNGECKQGQCTPATGQCKSITLPNQTPCDNEDWCDGAEFCNGGVCKSSSEVRCDDDDKCTKNICHEDTQQCEFAPYSEWDNLPKLPGSTDIADLLGDAAEERLYAANEKTWVYYLDVGADSWEVVGTALKINQGGDPHLCGKGTELFASWQDYKTKTWCGGGYGSGIDVRLRVKVWNGDDWTSMGGYLNVDSGKDCMSNDIAELDGTPWVVWTETKWSLVKCVSSYPSNYPVFKRGADSLFVKSWDGNSWSKKGGDLKVNDQYAEAVQMAFAGNVPLVAWIEGGTRYGGTSHITDGDVHARAWTGSSWDKVGVDFIPGYTEELSLASGPGDGVTLVARNSADSIYVFYWDGQQWSQLGDKITKGYFPNAVAVSQQDDIVFSYQQPYGTLGAATWSGLVWEGLPSPKCPGDEKPYEAALCFLDSSLVFIWGNVVRSLPWPQ